MAVHKVPQDVEAEDKFLGPLSFKQFLFFGGALITGFLMYQVIASGIPYLALVFLPFFAICVALAFPWTKDQPTELWLASRIRFLLVQRRRIWDQDDVKELVVITVPKREVHIYTDGLNQTQVHNRLNALASVIDSKGWVVKDLQGSGQAQSDRLVTNSQTQTNPTAQHDEPDPLDHGSTIAQQFDSMIQQSEEKRRQDTRNMVDQALHSTSGQPTATGQTPPAGASSPWFLHQNNPSPAGMEKFKTGFEESLTEQKFLDKVHKKQELDAKTNSNSRMKVIQPAGSSPQPGQATTDPAQQQNRQAIQPQQNLAQTAPAQNASATSSTAPDPAIMSLSQNDDLNVETIARQVNKNNELGDDEVVISLHED